MRICKFSNINPEIKILDCCKDLLYYVETLVCSYQEGLYETK